MYINKYMHTSGVGYNNYVFYFRVIKRSYKIFVRKREALKGLKMTAITLHTVYHFKNILHFFKSLGLYRNVPSV